MITNQKQPLYLYVKVKYILIIFKTFKNTALISVYNTFKFKASVRELGKVFGLPKEEIEKRLERARKYGTENPETTEKLKAMLRKYRFS